MTNGFFRQEQSHWEHTGSTKHEERLKIEIVMIELEKVEKLFSRFQEGYIKTGRFTSTFQEENSSVQNSERSSWQSLGSFYTSAVFYFSYQKLKSALTPIRASLYGISLVNRTRPSIPKHQHLILAATTSLSPFLLYCLYSRFRPVYQGSCFPHRRRRHPNFHFSQRSPLRDSQIRVKQPRKIPLGPDDSQYYSNHPMYEQDSAPQYKREAEVEAAW